MAITNVVTLKKMIPKTYKHRERVLSEIIAALSQHKYLEPALDRFVFNDGSAKILISLVGTVMMHYQGKVYNIPVCLWLDESYPRTAPICYVKPTKEMMVLTSGHVNNNGRINLPYLDEWRHTQCDLNMLIQVLIAVFGEKPPLCMRPDPCPKQALGTSQACSMEENSHLTINRDDGLPFQTNNETNC